MSKRNRNKHSRLLPQEHSKSSGSQDYDLTQSLNKVRQYSRYTKKNMVVEGTYSDEGQPYYDRQGFVSSNFSQYEEKTTGAPSWDRYDRLEDKFSSFSDKNEKEHTNLRKELEGKIERTSNDIKDEIKELRQNLDKKLSKQWYVWTIIALVAIVSVIWALSYQEVAKIPTEMIKLENRINQLEDDLLRQIQPKDVIKRK